LAQTREARFDSAISVLRRDVWSARRLTLVNANQLIVDQGAGAAITWQTTSNNALVRTTGTRSQSRWPDIAQGLAFSTQDRQLTLDFAEEGQLRLACFAAMTQPGSKP